MEIFQNRQRQYLNSEGEYNKNLICFFVWFQCKTIIVYLTISSRKLFHKIIIVYFVVVPKWSIVRANIHFNFIDNGNNHDENRA